MSGGRFPFFGVALWRGLLKHWLQLTPDHHYDKSGFALYWYKEAWCVVPIGLPPHSAIYEGDDLDEALSRMEVWDE